jgi:magnesium-transporting ATPase (P-type)
MEYWQFREAIGKYEIGFNEETGEREIKIFEKEKMKKAIKLVKVIARSTDEDKKILVHCIKLAQGYVLMSGDGINDTEALDLAHVGVSMGTSCQVTKDASDLVIMDNDIRSIYLSLMWGRTIYANVRKFIQFQMTMNISVVTVVLLAVTVMGLPPFNVIHLLWMNLVMDVLAAISICTEPFNSDPKNEEESSKLKRISKKKDKIFTNEMWRNILVTAFYQVLVMIILMFTGQFMFYENSFNVILTQPFMRNKETK